MMFPRFHAPLALATLLAALLCGCGQVGPLYQPPAEPPTETADNPQQ